MLFQQQECHFHDEVDIGEPLIGLNLCLKI
jgi:hypothetical protein